MQNVNREFLFLFYLIKFKKEKEKINPDFYID